MFNIALVEDEELERRAVRSILERNIEDVHIVGEAKNGSEALHLLDTQRIDLILLDIKIPRPNGMELLQMIRDRHLPTKVLIVTAYDYFEIMQSSIQLKADGFLLKPVRTEALLEAVRNCQASASSLPATPQHPDVSVQAVGQSPADPAEDGKNIRERILAYVEQRAYRDCLKLVRRRLETIYAHRETAPRHDVLDLIEILIDILAQSGRDLTPVLARQVDELGSQRLDARSHYKVQELFSQVTDMLFEASDERGGSAAQRIQTVLHFIERNVQKGISLEDAADFANVSPCYLSRLFRKEMNMTFISYLKAQRMERAKELLQNSDLPITNVSLDLSYTDANYFCKAFKKEVGVSPSEYRRQFHKPAAGSGGEDQAVGVQ
ncbi:response regulator [Tianweitania sp.]|uniref:response regulator n=1 Tax=Tianweitania sp. TaxID=2021634 RepID=UPI00289DE714|nr:response regulator [Tianweitania sp.]